MSPGKAVCTFYQARIVVFFNQSHSRVPGLGKARDEAHLGLLFRFDRYNVSDRNDWVQDGTLAIRECLFPYHCCGICCGSSSAYEQAPIRLKGNLLPIYLLGCDHMQHPVSLLILRFRSTRAYNSRSLAQDLRLYE